MKKILTTITQLFLILTLFVGLIFSNTASAGNIFAPFEYVFGGDTGRCSITYSRMSLMTGEVDTKRHTTQFQTGDPICSKGASKLAKKLKKWLSINRNYLLIDFVEPLECTESGGFLSRTWDGYEICKDMYQRRFVNYLIAAHPGQVDDKFVNPELHLK